MKDHISTERVIPIDPEVIDAQWMEAVLRGSGVGSEARIVGIDYEGLVGTGQLSRSARFRVHWDRPEGLPGSVIAKLPGEDPAACATLYDTGLYQAEVGFYREVRPTNPVRAPHCWYAAIDVRQPGFVLLLEDLAGSRQGDQFSGTTAEETELAIEQAVVLHASRWGDPTLDKLAALNSVPLPYAERLDATYSACVGPCLDRLGERLDADVRGLVEDFAKVARRWAWMQTGTPHTLVHGDFRPDNFMFGAAPGSPPLAVLDWQTMFAGLGATDIAYLLAGSHTTERRRECEGAFLEFYRAGIEGAGIEYPVEAARRDYAWGSLHGVVVGVTATMMARQTERGDRLFTMMIDRHARQALDHGALDLINATRGV